MATFNLIRNSRVFFTSNVNSAGVIQATGFTAGNSQELQVLDGFTFSQASNADTITIAEAGNTPVRGQRSFNTSLANVEFSFSTYVRPKLNTTIKAEEAVLWNALLGDKAVGSTGTTATTVTAVTTSAGLTTFVGTFATALTVGNYYIVNGARGAGASEYNKAIKVTSASTSTIIGSYLIAPSVTPGTPLFTAAAGTVTFSTAAWNEVTTLQVAADTTAPQYNSAPAIYSFASSGLSNKNQLQAFGMLIKVDGVTYAIDNCAMDQATIDFGLDGIATIAWTGKGTALRQLSTVTIDDTAPALPVLSGGAVGTVTGKVTTAPYITNKLSTVSLQSQVGGGGTSYTMALTGGSVTIANNINYITPANLGIVNIPIGYYTGTRAVSGSLTAYLRTGTNGTADLLNNLLTNASTSIEPKFSLKLQIGGAAAGTRVELNMPATFLQIPTVDAQAVMSTTINFTAEGGDQVQGTAGAGFDIEQPSEIEIRYLSLL